MPQLTIKAMAQRAVLGGFIAATQSVP